MLDDAVLKIQEDPVDAGEPVAAESAGDDAPVSSRLLDTLAAFTRHRDAAALDHSLVLSLAELTAAHSAVLARRALDGPYVESIVHCVLGPSGYQVHLADADKVELGMKLLHRCLHRLEVQSAVVEGLHRLVVPIMREGKAIGALQLDSPMAPQACQPLAEGFARIYANYTALLQESERDKLTGLYNRRSLDRQLQRMLHERELAQQAPPQPEPAPAPEPAIEEHRHPAAPELQHVWLAILDIDHFKRINDNYGHIYGDEVILLLAQQMRACFRRSDVLFRFGGEEFVILFSAAEEATVRTVLERFRQRIAGYAFPQVGSVTVSIGYARVGKLDYPASALDRADKALYFAKQNGRNSTHGYEELMERGLLSREMTAGSIDLF